MRLPQSHTSVSTESLRISGWRWPHTQHIWLPGNLKLDTAQLDTKLASDELERVPPVVTALELRKPLARSRSPAAVAERTVELLHRHLRAAVRQAEISFLFPHRRQGGAHLGVEGELAFRCVPIAADRKPMVPQSAALPADPCHRPFL